MRTDYQKYLEMQRVRVTEISAGSREQGTGAEQIDKATRQNTPVSEEMASTAEEFPA